MTSFGCVGGPRSPARGKAIYENHTDICMFAAVWHDRLLGLLFIEDLIDLTH
jgi:hypothetical protein